MKPLQFPNIACTRSLSAYVLATENIAESAFEAGHDRVKGRQGDTSLIVLQAVQGCGIDANPFGEVTKRKIATLFLQKTGEFLVQYRWWSHLDRLPAKVLPMGNTLLDVAYRQRRCAAP
ncbi:MAG TPA: hypothetical protein VL981_05185 [Candidatus Methylacidiphilales bacterium]|nr:hypothetical protein [Candidatus Methylacidiphilales bacterium]